jgi:hypothetical protein
MARISTGAFIVKTAGRPVPQCQYRSFLPYSMSGEVAGQVASHSIERVSAALSISPGGGEVAGGDTAKLSDC